MLLMLCRRRFLMLCVFFFTFGMPVGVAQEALKLVNHAWAPYSGETLLQKGLAIEIVTTALHRSGYKTKVQIVPWKRALKGTFSGTYDILMTTSFSEERAKKVLYSEPYLMNDISFIKRSGTGYVYNSLNDLDGLTIGVIDGYIYEPMFDMATNFTKEKIVSDALALKMLVAGRIDLVIVDRLVAAYTIKQEHALNWLNIETLPNPLNSKHLHIIIRKTKPGHEKIIADFNTSLAQMRVDGTYTDILNRHLNSLK